MSTTDEGRGGNTLKAVNVAFPPQRRPLGAPSLPRRRFVAPAAVRLAQCALGVRIAFVGALVLAAGARAIPTRLALPGSVELTLPGAAAWRPLAAWIVVACLFETMLVLRLGTLRTGSRRLVVLVESVAIVVSGLYVAAGFDVALIPLVAAIASVVLLRLDHVRHSFNRAHAERRLIGRHVPSVLYSGYALPEPTAEKPAQYVGYRLGIDCAPIEPTTTSSSSA
jgi:hypothetical protein